MESTALWILRKAAHIIQYSFCDTVVPSLFDGIIFHSQRKSCKGLYIHLDNARPHNAWRCTECLRAKESSEYRTRFTARNLHQVTTSSLVISREDSLNPTSELKKRDHPHFRRHRTRNPHSCLRNMDQQARVGDGTQKGVLPFVNEGWKKMIENSVKKPEDMNFLTPDRSHCRCVISLLKLFNINTDSFTRCLSSSRSLFPKKTAKLPFEILRQTVAGGASMQIVWHSDCRGSQISLSCEGRDPGSRWHEMHSPNLEASLGPNK
jgi:hypothetical protein